MEKIEFTLEVELEEAIQRLDDARECLVKCEAEHGEDSDEYEELAWKDTDQDIEVGKAVGEAFRSGVIQLRKSILEQLLKHLRPHGFDQYELAVIDQDMHIGLQEEENLWPIWYLYWSGGEGASSVNPDYAQDDLAARGWLMEKEQAARWRAQ